MLQGGCESLCNGVMVPGWKAQLRVARLPPPPASSRRRLVRSAVGSQQVDSAPAAAPTAAQPHLECFGTGLEVECRIVADGPQHITDAIVADTAVTDAQQLNEQKQGPLSLLDTLLLISPFFFWGTSMVAMKELAPHTTPLLVAAWRLIPAGAALLVWAAQSGRPQPREPMAWLAVALFGLVDGACFQGFLAEGLQRTSAGLGSVIIDSQPLSVALLASLLFGERLGSAGVAGLFLGIFGLSLLEVPPSMLTSLLPGGLSEAATSLLDGGGGDLAAALAASTSSSSASLAAAAPAAAEAAVGSISGAGGSEWSIWDSGEWWMLLAAQSMAVGTVMVRWVAKYCDPVMATGWHMVLGGLPLLALAAVQEGAAAQERLALLTGSDIALLLYITLLGSAASYGVFFYNASRGNLTALSSLTFLTPMFAAAGGYLALGETLTPLQLAGAAVTLGAVTLINNNSSDSGSGGSSAGSNGRSEGSSSNGSKPAKGAS